MFTVELNNIAMLSYLLWNPTRGLLCKSHSLKLGQELKILPTKFLE